jgi:uracil-DNA glycosylase
LKSNPLKVKNVRIHESWKTVLNDEFEKEYFAKIKSSLKEAKSQGQIIHPKCDLIFNAFNKTPFEEIKVVILGQDPYHGIGQAMGLSFSVPKTVRIPPSLKNIFKEIHLDVGMEIPNHGDLTIWAEQGVFLLNSILTVRHKEPGSHKKIGWQEFTDAVIKKISDEREGIVFLLWGNFAKKKIELIDESKHHVLMSAHPSPLAGNRFFNNHHFSQTNLILKKIGKEPIDWGLPKMY